MAAAFAAAVISEVAAETAFVSAVSAGGVGMCTTLEIGGSLLAEGAITSLVAPVIDTAAGITALSGEAMAGYAGAAAAAGAASNSIPAMGFNSILPTEVVGATLEAGSGAMSNVMGGTLAGETALAAPTLSASTGSMLPGLGVPEAGINLAAETLPQTVSGLETSMLPEGLPGPVNSFNGMPPGGNMLDAMNLPTGSSFLPNSMQIPFKELQAGVADAWSQVPQWGKDAFNAAKTAKSVYDMGNMANNLMNPPPGPQQRQQQPQWAQMNQQLINPQSAQTGFNQQPVPSYGLAATSGAFGPSRGGYIGRSGTFGFARGGLASLKRRS